MPVQTCTKCMRLTRVILFGPLFSQSFLLSTFSLILSCCYTLPPINSSRTKFCAQRSRAKRRSVQLKKALWRYFFDSPPDVAVVAQCIESIKPTIPNVCRWYYSIVHCHSVALNWLSSLVSSSAHTFCLCNLFTSNGLLWVFRWINVLGLIQFTHQLS